MGCAAQVDKDIAKALGAMRELEEALRAKKEVSARAKGLAKALEGARAEAAALAVQQEHLRRQQDIFGERIASAKEQVRGAGMGGPPAAGLLGLLHGS